MSDECICIGFSINKRCRVHGNPESVMANEMIRARKSINLQIKDLQQKLKQENLKKEEAIEVIRRLLYVQRDSEHWDSLATRAFEMIRDKDEK